MIDTEAKYHHLIPQVYMSPWANSSGTLKVEFIKNPGTVVIRNTEHIAGITNFHTIKAGMPLCTQEDTDKLFSSLTGYSVEYEGKKICSTIEMNKAYYDFDKWTITQADGSLVGKKKIQNDIEQVKIRDIEANWSSKYENRWGDEVSKIENSVLKCETDSIPAFDLDFLMHFYTALDWRGFNSNPQFEDALTRVKSVLGDIDMPKDKRILPFLKTGWEEMRHYLLLQYYRQYLKDTGVIFKDATLNLENTNFHFLISDGPTMFNTSDTPVFTYKRSDKKLVGLMPITPRILMAKGRCVGDHSLFYVSHITDTAVQKYNQAIRDNATEFIILPN